MTRKIQILFHIHKNTLFPLTLTQRQYIFLVPEFWLQFFRILFSAGSVGLKDILKSLCIHICGTLALRVRVQNFCFYRFGSRSIMVDLFPLVHLSISSIHKPVATERSEFNTHCRSNFHLSVSRYNTPSL